MLRHDGRQPLPLIFGAVERCIAVHPSDTAPALIALNAKIVTNKRTVEAEAFFDVKVPGNTVLAADEIITAIQVPTPCRSEERLPEVRDPQVYRLPDRELRSSAAGGAPRICLNAVAPKPYRATRLRPQSPESLSMQRMQKQPVRRRLWTHGRSPRPVQSADRQDSVKRALLATV